MYENRVILREAIRHQRPVVGLGNGLRREFCPHVLGETDGVWRVFAWQFAGLSESGLRDGGDWRCHDPVDDPSGAGPDVHGPAEGLPSPVCSPFCILSSLHLTSQLQPDEGSPLAAECGGGACVKYLPSDQTRCMPKL